MNGRRMMRMLGLAALAAAMFWPLATQLEALTYLAAPDGYCKIEGRLAVDVWLPGETDGRALPLEKHPVTDDNDNCKLKTPVAEMNEKPFPKPFPTALPLRTSESTDPLPDGKAAPDDWIAMPAPPSDPIEGSEWFDRPPILDHRWVGELVKLAQPAYSTLALLMFFAVVWSER